MNRVGERGDGYADASEWATSSPAERAATEERRKRHARLLERHPIQQDWVLAVSKARRRRAAR